MKVLWITNILFPEAQEQLINGSGELKASGGWMLGAANAILKRGDIKLYVATVSSLVSQFTRIEGKKITYYVLPFGKGNQDFNMDYCPYWEQIQKDITPDVVHIHGTEYSQGYAYMKACGSDNVVISIQGLLSACANFYLNGISKKDVFRNLTFRDIIKGSVIHCQKQYKKRSLYEIEMIKMAKHIIGRTSWDKSHVWAINPHAEYHFCNEILRDDFYSGEQWDYGKCRKYSIFLSQAGYPIKGFHQLLKAMPLILRHYPDTIIRVAGCDITQSSTISDILRFSGYGRYIKRLIKSNNLERRISFIGTLNAEQMKQEYLSANVFVCPSTVDNSPNSIGEAQILGTPCVASYVGGIPDMMKGNEMNLYRFEEIEMLAEIICRVFEHSDCQQDMRNIAMSRHNPDVNGDRLVYIYNQIKN